MAYVMVSQVCHFGIWREIKHTPVVVTPGLEVVGNLVVNAACVDAPETADVPIVVTSGILVLAESLNNPLLYICVYW